MQTTTYWDQLISRSSMRFFMLACLARKPMHGYELAKAIAGCCDQCCFPTDAMIYPSIKALQKEGLVSCSTEEVQGRQRKVCALTAAGQEAYRAAAASWARYLPHLTAAVEGANKPGDQS